MLSPDFAKWEKTRRKGREHFVWVWGVLAWGLTCGLLMTAFAYAVDKGRHPAPLIYILPIFLFPVGGYYWGSWVWMTMEKKYDEHLRSRQAQEQVSALQETVETLERRVAALESGQSPGTETSIKPAGE